MRLERVREVTFITLGWKLFAYFFRFILPPSSSLFAFFLCQSITGLWNTNFEDSRRRRVLLHSFFITCAMDHSRQASGTEQHLNDAMNKQNQYLTLALKGKGLLHFILCFNWLNLTSVIQHATLPWTFTPPSPLASKKTFHTDSSRIEKWWQGAASTN